MLFTLTLYVVGNLQLLELDKWIILVQFSLGVEEFTSVGQLYITLDHKKYELSLLSFIVTFIDVPSA